MWPARVRLDVEASVNFPMPKSVTFTRPSRPTRMLPGLTSRWSTPRSCAWPSASATWRTIPIFAASGNASFAPRYRVSGRPSTCSIAMKQTSPSRPTS